MRKNFGLTVVLGMATALLTAGSPHLVSGEEMGPYGPGLELNYEAVRSFTLKTSGAITKEIKAVKGQGKTGLTGNCNPKMFANFGIHRGGPFDAEQVGIALISRDAIGMGITGTFPLNMVQVDFFDLPNGTRRFTGPGTLTLTVHNPSPRKRRMTGTISGSNLKGLEKEEGKTLDVIATFDLDFSCGVQ